MEQFVKREYSGLASIEQTVHTAQRHPYDLIPATTVSSPQDVAGECSRHCREETAISGTQQAEVTPGLVAELCASMGRGCTARGHTGARLWLPPTASPAALLGRAHSWAEV